MAHLESHNHNLLITRHLAQTFEEVLDCCYGECDGEMEFTGYSHPMNPPLNSHRCNKCGQDCTVSGETFPRMVTQRVEPTIPLS